MCKETLGQSQDFANLVWVKVKSNPMISVYFYCFYCQQLILRLSLYTIISFLVILDVFGQFYVVARGWSKSPSSSTKGFFVLIVDDVQPIAIVKKGPVWKTDVALDPLLAASARLSSIKCVAYIVMQKTLV